MTRSLAYIGPALALVGVLVFTAFAPKARAAMEGLTEPESPRTHQLVECAYHSPCRPRGRPMGETACKLDAASLANVLPKGSRTTCERVKR